MPIGWSFTALAIARFHPTQPNPQDFHGYIVDGFGIVTVDGRQSTHDTIVPADGRVFIFPPMFGG